MTGPAGRPARGRRDNGLDARDFVPLLDVDPRVGEHLLDVLGLAGIAAYLQPSADLNPIIRSTTLPSRPTDRLWVDRRFAGEARSMLASIDLDDIADPARDLTDPPARPRADSASSTGSAARNPAAMADSSATAGPGGADDLDPRRDRDPHADRDLDRDLDPELDRDLDDDLDLTSDLDDDLDVEAAWEQIVASFDAPVTTPVPSWPAAEDTDDDTDVDSGRGGPSVDVPTNGFRAFGPPTPGPRDSVLAEPDDELANPDDEGYTPPPPPPFPRPSSHAVVGVLAAVVGFVLFFRPSVLGIDQSATMVLGVLGVLGGAAMLVYRLRDGLTTDDDPDDGAVV
jgi:hypothetical protein